jgi:hypothetical protein
MDIIKAAVGKDSHHVTWYQYGLKMIQDIVSVCKGKGGNTFLFEICCKPCLKKKSTPRIFVALGTKPH